MLLSIAKSEIFKLFRSAEQTIKLVENLSEGIIFPAVNQLRYAGQHLLKSDCIDKPDLKEEHLKKAKYHCQRAIYDASEMGIIHYLGKIRIFNDDYKQVVITEILPSYPDILTKAKKASDFIIKNPNKRVHDDETINKIDADYKESEKLLKELEESVDLLEIIRPELNKKIERNRFFIFIAISGLVLSMIAICATIIYAT